MKLELKGWKAFAALAVVVAVVGGKYLAERRTLESEAAEELRFWLHSEYLAREMHGVDPEQLTDEQAEAMGAELLELGDIEFTSISARGRGDDVAVKVEIRVAGRDPPDGRPLRYFRMEHSLVTGWRLRYETTALSYYLKFF